MKPYEHICSLEGVYCFDIYQTGCQSFCCMADLNSEKLFNYCLMKNKNKLVLCDSY